MQEEIQLVTGTEVDIGHEVTPEFEDGLEFTPKFTERQPLQPGLVSQLAAEERRFRPATDHKGDVIPGTKVYQNRRMRRRTAANWLRASRRLV